MADIATIAAWLAGLALAASMVPHQVRSIRLVALVAGLAAVVHFAAQGGFSAGLAIALGFVLINALRLLELHRRARSGTMTSEERELFDHVMQIENPSRQNRLKDLMIWRDVGVGERLIEQGQQEPPLIYIASGRAAIVRDGEVVSECGPGEFVGEMSHISGERASATVSVTHTMRMARLDRDALAQLARSLPEVGRAVDSAFNRSLAVKVLRMNQAAQSAEDDAQT